MKSYVNGVVISNEEISFQIYSMWIKQEHIAKNAQPGQFVEIYMNDKALVLPRPISICDANAQNGTFNLTYQVVGKGTAWLSCVKAGACINLLGPLGNGFKISKGENHVVVGGGIGLPPLLFLCRKIMELQSNPGLTVFAGFKNRSILKENFQKLGIEVHVATESGNEGFLGNVVQLLTRKKVETGAFYCCGPKKMLEFVSDYAKSINAPCQISMEERMACGFGVCVGCVVKIAHSQEEKGWVYKKVCVDGPVFDSREVVF